MKEKKSSLVTARDVTTCSGAIDTLCGYCALQKEKLCDLYVVKPKDPTPIIKCRKFVEVTHDTT